MHVVLLSPPPPLQPKNQPPPPINHRPPPRRRAQEDLPAERGEAQPAGRVPRPGLPVRFVFVQSCFWSVRMWLNRWGFIHTRRTPRDPLRENMHAHLSRPSADVSIPFPTATADTDPYPITPTHSSTSAPTTSASTRRTRAACGSRRAPPARTRAGWCCLGRRPSRRRESRCVRGPLLFELWFVCSGVGFQGLVWVHNGPLAAAV